MIETEFVKGLQVVINTMRRLINENETYMDETCNRKRLSKDRQRLWHGRNSQEDIEEHSQSDP